MKTLILLIFLFGAQFAGAEGRHSGIIGQAFITICPVLPPGGCPPSPYETSVSVFNAKGRLVAEIDTDENGMFSVNLKPGVYTLVPLIPEPPHYSPYSPPITVRVAAKRFTPVTIGYYSTTQ